MRRPQSDDGFSSDESEQTDIESCFDTDDERDSDTNLIDLDTNLLDGDDEDLSWLYEDDQDHPPGYYLQ
jgi:hypothetical protein